jgi:predicted ATPase/DNA-binding winged helix-turn-helix (wHTH) protein
LTDTLLTFGPFQLSPARQSLLRDGKPVRLGGRAFDLLTALAERAGEIVGKEDLIERVWPNMVVEETSLRVHVAALRKILGDGGAGDRFINTVAGRGYCFVARVGRSHNAETAPASAGAAKAAHNLPVPLTRMIGRDRAVDVIAGQLFRRRCVTIVGPGGIGKTTIALVTAGNLVGSYTHGICFVDFAPLADYRLVPTALASMLGIAVRAEDPLPGLLAHLWNKSMLIVLDNCEHVIEPAAFLVEGILGGAPDVHVLATSREPFRVGGESVYRLAPLALPPHSVPISAADARGFAAVELFAERAAAVQDTFELTDANVATVRRICRRLDGIPLAIELAAAHVYHFGLEEIAARLTDSFALLIIGRRTALSRHRTLRATLDWSHGLLSADEQTVLRRLARMAGRFGIEAAAAIVADDALPAHAVLETMGGLIDKSLVTTDLGGEAIQYRLLETTRAYAAEKLAQSSDTEPVARRYALYFRALIRRSEAQWQARPGGDWLANYGASIDDVRAAIDWAFTPDGDLAIGLDLTAAAAQLFFQLSLMREYWGRAERALQRLRTAAEPDAVLEMRLQSALGHSLWYSTASTGNEPEVMERAFARALELAEQVGDSMAQLQALWGLWAARRLRREYRAALVLATRYETVAKDLGERRFMILGDRILGLTHHFLGNQALARQFVDRVREQTRNPGPAQNTDFQLDPRIAMPTLLARIQWIQGFPDQARATVQEAIDAAVEADHWLSLCYVLGTTACPLALWLDDQAQIQRYLGMLLDRGSGSPVVAMQRRCFAELLRLRQGSAADRLIAAFIEPRLDLSTVDALTALALASAPTIAVPLPEAEPTDALWSLPEVLRVDAELLLWHAAPSAPNAAETKLLRSLDVARRQSALSWELRSATSLARLWGRAGRTTEGRDLLAAICDRFSEGFGTADVIAARQLLALLS